MVWSARIANGVVRGGAAYKAMRAAGEGRWSAALTGFAAATNNQKLMGASKVAQGIQSKDVGLILSGAGSVTGSDALTKGGQLARAVQHRDPEQALALIGDMAGEPRLTALAKGVKAIRTKDVPAILNAVDQLSPELKGVVMGQLDGIAETLPKPAGDLLRKEANNRFKDSARLLRAINSKDPSSALAALGDLTGSQRLSGLGQGIDGIRSGDPAAIAEGLSKLSPELRAAATAQMAQAARTWPPAVRNAVSNELAAGFENSRRFINGIESKNPAKALGALGNLADSDRLKELGRGVRAIQNRDVSEITDALMKLSPDLRKTATENLAKLSANLPPKVAEGLRREVRNRFANTADFIKAADRKDPEAALSALAKISGSKRLEGLAKGSRAVRKSDIPEMLKALDKVAPEVRGWASAKLDELVEKMPPELKKAVEQYKAKKFDGVRDLIDSLNRRQPAQALESLAGLRRLAGAPTPIGPLQSLATLGDLSPHMRELATAGIAAIAEDLPPAAQAYALQELSAHLGVPLDPRARRSLAA